MITRRLTAVLVLLLCLHATRALAEVAVGTSLDEADRRYGELDYRGAAELAQSAAQEPTATPANQVRGWERVGLCWLVLGQHRLAREAFDKLFNLDPKHEVVDPSLSPRQHEYIEEVRAKHPAPAPPPPPPPTPTSTPTTTVVAAPAPPVVVQKPVWKRWYVWTPIAIGVVAGVSLGVGLGLGLHRDGPSGSLGTVGLGLRF